MDGRDTCIMSVRCTGKPADHGLMCEYHRRQDQQIERAFSDDVQPDQRPPLPLRLLENPHAE